VVSGVVGNVGKNVISVAGGKVIELLDCLSPPVSGVSNMDFVVVEVVAVVVVVVVVVVVSSVVVIVVTLVTVDISVVVVVLVTVLVVTVVVDGVDSLPQHSLSG